VVLAQARSLFETNVFSPFGQSQTSKAHVETIRRLTDSAARMAARADLDYVFIHLPAPHGPFVFDRRTGQPDAWSWPKVEGYLDNLGLADRIFWRIRTEMERAGVWERSVVLVTADHGYRDARLLGFPPEDRHVPFMLKTLPGQRLRLDPKVRLETIDTGKILAELLGF
jgi:arylsulfatase A-like enzyme